MTQSCSGRLVVNTDFRGHLAGAIPISDPGGSHDVFLVFRPVAGWPGNNFFNLNWVEFGGEGISLCREGSRSRRAASAPP